MWQKYVEGRLAYLETRRVCEHFAKNATIANCEYFEYYDSSSEWSPFCEEGLYYKPYVRISQGRNGPVLRDRGPGFIELGKKEDLYICVNGLVFFYFKIVNLYGRIYDEAVMQYAAHYCGFFNGQVGPGTGKREKTLEAILLIGHPQDYRKIALQMFIAPVINPSTSKLTNFTSLVIINSKGECLLEKGVEKARIRVRSNPPESIVSYTYTTPEEERHTTMCRFDGTTHIGQGGDPQKIPLEAGTAGLEEVVDALDYEHEEELNFLGCYDYPLLNQQQIDIIRARVDEVAQDKFFIDKGKSELNPDDGVGVKFWTKERLEKYGHPLLDPDETALGEDLMNKNSTYNSEFTASPKDHGKIKAAKDELELALIRFTMIPYFNEYKEEFDLAKKFSDEAKDDWNAVWNFVQDDAVNSTRIGYTTILQEISSLQQDRLLDPYNTKMVEDIKEAEVKAKDELVKLEEHTLKLAPLITKAEVSYHRRKSFVARTKLDWEKLKKKIVDFEKYHKPVSEFVSDPEEFEDTIVSIKNENGVDDACTTLERRQDQCKFVKPSAQRACQIGMNRGGKGKDWASGEDRWRDEVFQLLEKIFTKICPYLKGDFATAVNRIVKGYLIGEPKGTGVDDILVGGAPEFKTIRENYMKNYKIDKKDDLYPDLKPKDPSWDEIMKALENCEKDGSTKPLQFDYASMRPLRYKFMGKDIPGNVEQADLEFSFNWAIDMNYFVFGTVLGSCMKSLGVTLSKQFYERYFEDFLDPIRPIWLSNRDNSILKVVLGRYFVTGKGDLWTSQCLESSFVQSGQANMRPLRKLYVNSYSELNFFVDGPMKGERGEYL